MNYDLRIDAIVVNDIRVQVNPQELQSAFETELVRLMQRAEHKLKRVVNNKLLRLDELLIDEGSDSHSIGIGLAKEVYIGLTGDMEVE